MQHDNVEVPSFQPLDRAFYERTPQRVARDLLGKALVRHLGGGWVGGLIVETEAYLSQRDPASHSHKGMSPRNRSMFAPAGTLYVYTIHAKFCLNAVTEQEGVGSAVLLRALEPIWGVTQMQRNRNKQALRELCRGPAMLCQALQVTTASDGTDLCTDKDLLIADLTLRSQFRVLSSPRIGISRAQAKKLRFFVDGNQFVSGRARDHRQPNRHRLLGP